MKCPYCRHREDRVVDSRESREGEVIRRRRQCLSCGKRFTSYEALEKVVRMVVKKDGRREPYNRGKVLSGLAKACGTRVALEQVDAIADRVEGAIEASPDLEIEAKTIGELLMEGLKASDHVAYVRFASVYRDFQDPDDFVREIRSLIRRRRGD